MTSIFQSIELILIGLGAGYVLSGGIVAFITIIGVVPIMAYRTKTQHYMMWYENMIILGSILATLLTCWEISIPIGPVMTVILFFAFGVFVGAFIIALAEILDVFPIINRRIKMRKGIAFILIALALGKLVGSLCYWIYPYFIQIYL